MNEKLNKVRNIFKENEDNQQAALWIAEELGTEEGCQIPSYIDGELVEEYDVLDSDVSHDEVPRTVQDFGDTRLIAFSPLGFSKKVGPVVYQGPTNYFTPERCEPCFWLTKETLEALREELFNANFDEGVTSEEC